MAKPIDLTIEIDEDGNIKVKVNGTIKNAINSDTLKTFPFPIVIHNFIEKDFLS